MPDYLPIAEHGIMGDLHTIALAATDGTIDWYCCPSFDSPSVFGARGFARSKTKRRRDAVIRLGAIFGERRRCFPDGNAHDRKTSLGCVIEYQLRNPLAAEETHEIIF